MAEKQFGRKHPAYATTLQGAGSVMIRLGKPAEAAALCRTAIDIFTKKRVAGDENIAALLDTLGTALDASGRSAEAEPYRAGALRIARTTPRFKKVHLAKIPTNHATTCWYLGRLSEAEQLLRESISINEKTIGRDNHHVAQQMNNLARLLYYGGRYEAAEQAIDEGLALKEALYTKRHPTLAISLATRALIFRDTNRLAESEKLFKEALEILSEAFGPDHAEIGFVRAALARLMALNGQESGAKLQAQQAFAIEAKNLRTGSLWNRPEANELALALDSVGLAGEAVEIRTRYGLN